MNLLCPSLLCLLASLPVCAQTPQVFGFRDFTQQARWDSVFLAAPDPVLAGQHLKTLTQAPHIASSKEDYATAEYVAQKFKAAGLETQIVPYRVLLNLPKKIQIEAFDASGRKIMSGPAPEHVDSSDPQVNQYQNDPRVTPAFNGASPSGDVTAEAVYANYGTPADFKELAKLNVQVKGKIVIVRYGANYRGIKVYDAQRAGAAGVIIYSDPFDDGYNRGDLYPNGPYRPATAVQRGATQFLPIYPGDATTPGIAADPDLPDAKRIPSDKIQANWPSIPVNPLSYQDAAPILKALAGPNVPHEWQGSLPFPYHTGQAGQSLEKAKSVTVHMHLEQDTQLRTIWDVIGVIEGTDPAEKDDWVVAGNHRDAWVFGAVDPNSGTAAMLETVHGLGALLHAGWKPKRRIVVGSWDAEEEGLIGSTEWVEGHGPQLRNAVAYFNTDVAVSGPNFNASAIPSLKQFVREVTARVPSPAGGTVYDQWLKGQTVNANRRAVGADDEEAAVTDSKGAKEVRVGDLGSGSDFTPFLQHEGVPSTDIGSGGPYGVYHSVFDNYDWFVRNADPHFVYEQQQARVLGLEIIHMADADVLPYDYSAYARQIGTYLNTSETHAKTAGLQLDFTAAKAAASRFAQAAASFQTLQQSASPAKSGGDQQDAARNGRGVSLPGRAARAQLVQAHHLRSGRVYRLRCGRDSGVNEGIDATDQTRTQTQLAVLTRTLTAAAETLEGGAR